AYTGTYRVAGDHDLFLGGLLGDTTFTYHDFRTGRIGALHPSSETTFFAGPALFRPAPPELHVTFLRCPGGQVDEIRLRSAAGELAAVRLPVVEEEVTFHNGAVTLAGTLMLPPTAGPHPAVVLIHGSGRQTRACVRSWADYFVHRGIAALIYDKRGAGASTRGPEWYEDLAGDAVAGLRLLQHHPAIDPRAIGLWGSSQGGWIAPLGAVQCPDVAFIVLMAGPAVSIATQNVQNVACSMRAAGYDEAKIAAAVAYTERLNELWPTGQGWEELKAGYELAAREGWAGYIGHPGAEPPRPPTPEQRRRRHHEMHREPAAVLERVRCPVLALFGEQDTCVPPAGNADLMAAALQRGGNPDYTVKVIPGANHLGYVATPDGSLTSCTHFIPQYHQLAAHWIRARAGTRP
ncbi:MAG TPA: alpha/beta fold hydrolase, partial [Chloroflexota bacterium]|nr:alpha/beta fold hydrolase [Chloroflexota bacterium]